MEKARKILTMFVVAMLTLCMGCMVFGYNTTKYWLNDRNINPGRNYYGDEIFIPSESEYVAMNAYYYSVAETGTCEVGAYRVGSGNYVKHGSQTKNIQAYTVAGFIPYSIHLDASKEYKAFIKSTGTEIDLRYLKVAFDK